MENLKLKQKMFRYVSARTAPVLVLLPSASKFATSFPNIIIVVFSREGTMMILLNNFVTDDAFFCLLSI
jgi:hypothetical protein